MSQLKRPLKAYKWWDSEPPVMLALVYYELSLARLSGRFGDALAAIALFLVATLGIAGFGHLLNDLCDREEDRRSATHNMTAMRTPSQLLGFFALLLLLSWLPWLWLPASPYVLGALLAEFSLFFAYSVPPLRLKGRGLLGAVADGLYAYTIPVLVSLLVFARFGHLKVSPWLVAVVSTWTLTVGLRWVLVHQLQELSRDQRSGVETFAVRRGWRPTVHFLVFRLLPVEAALLVLTVLVLGRDDVLLTVGFAAYLAVQITVHRRRGRLPMPPPSREVARLVEINVNVMSGFHTRWLPLLLLAGLCLEAPAFLLLLALHLLCFENGLTPLLRSAVGAISRSSGLARHALT